MYRGSTPTLRIACDSDISGIEHLEVLCAQSSNNSCCACHKQNKFVLEPKNLDKETGTFEITLTQEQTLSFSAGYPVKFQLKATDDLGNVAYSNIFTVRVQDTLDTNTNASNKQSSYFSSGSSGCECTLHAHFEAEFIAMGEFETYKGDYVITPSAHVQTLPTQNKVLTNDITVNEIKVSETPNNAGGITLEI